jgi:hypothetical protein
VAGGFNAHRHERAAFTFGSDKPMKFLAHTRQRPELNPHPARKGHAADQGASEQGPPRLFAVPNRLRRERACDW